MQNKQTNSFTARSKQFEVEWKITVLSTKTYRLSGNFDGPKSCLRELWIIQRINSENLQMSVIEQLTQPLDLCPVN